MRDITATALVEIGKKRQDEVVQEMMSWADDDDPNVRRTSSEGLRGVARKNPEKVLPVIDKLKTASHLYVKKSVANVLRNAGKKNHDFVLDLCRKWATLRNKDTNWIIKNGLRKLRESRPQDVKEILNLIS